MENSDERYLSTTWSFSWSERVTNDLEPAKHFYTKLVDWKIEAMSMAMAMASGEEYTRDKIR